MANSSAIPNSYSLQGKIAEDVPTVPGLHAHSWGYLAAYSTKLPPSSYSNRCRRRLSDMSTCEYVRHRNKVT